MFCKTLVNLNYTASAEALQYACKESGITRVLTARRFISNLQKRGIELSELLPDQELIYLEDMRAYLQDKLALDRAVIQIAQYHVFVDC